MDYEPGGRADKLGNQYESKWIAKQLLNLLNEEIVSVTVEAVGPDEQGVDLWIVDKDKNRIACQCKGRNGSKESWSVSDLKNKKILEKLAFQLDHDPSIQFHFISGNSATCAS